MGMTPEGRVKKAVRELLDEHEIWFYQPMQNGMGRVGIPDFICCWHGRFLAIETKAPGKVTHLTANQKRVLEEIGEHGGMTIVVDDAEDLREYLTIFKKAPNA